MENREWKKGLRVWKLIVLFVASSLYAMPSWMYKLPNENPNVYIGYGVGSSDEKAKERALNDIASQISVQIKSSLHLQTDINGSSIEKKAHSSIVQNTQGSLSDYKLLHSVYEDGKYYVAISYENIPSFDKFIKKIKKLYANVKQMPVLHNRYLANSSIATKLKKVFGKAISFELVRKDKKWFIKHQNIMQILDDKDFAKFFVSVLNDNISIMLNNKKRVLYNGDEFYFLIKSKKSGFVTLFDVYEDGTVTTLMRNIPVKKGVVQQMPDSEFESIPQAGLIDPNKETYDLYVALYSKKKLSFDSFAYAGDEITNAERYKNFDEFIELLDGKVFASLKVVVKPR